MLRVLPLTSVGPRFYPLFLQQFNSIDISGDTPDAHKDVRGEAESLTMEIMSFHILSFFSRTPFLLIFSYVRIFVLNWG